MINANIAPKNIPKVKKKLIVEPDLSINFLGTSLGAIENNTDEANPLLIANRLICMRITKSKKIPYLKIFRKIQKFFK